LLQARKLDIFFEAEEKLFNKQTLERPIIDILCDTECGTADDKLRLFLLYFMFNTQSPKEQVMGDLFCFLQQHFIV
jgi:hypothetical protein